ncbi:MAG: Ig-like domain-containing protein [Planctomycetota bacterium]
MRPRPSPLAVSLGALLAAACSGGGRGSSPAVDAALSSVTPSATVDVVADGATAVLVEVLLRDEGGQPLAGREVQIAASGSENFLVQPAGPTDGEGRATGSLATTAAEVKTLTVTAEPGPRAVVLDDSPTVEFIGDPNAISATLSTLAAAPAADVIADGLDTTTLTVRVRDVHGNPVRGQTVELAATGSANVLTQPPAPTGAAGEAAGTLASTRAETKTITAVVNPGPAAIPLAAAAEAEFAGDPATIDSALSGIEAAPAAGVVANGVDGAVVTVTVRDAFGNPVEGQVVALAATGDENVLSPPASPTGADGRAAGFLATTAAETKIVGAVVNPGPSEVSLDATAAVGFIGDLATVSPVLSTVAVDPAAGVVADGGEVSAIAVTVRDAYANPVPGAAVLLAATGSANALEQPPALTDAEGHAWGSLASTKAEVKTVTVVVEPDGAAVLLAAAPTIEFVGDPSTIDPGLSSLAAIPSAGLLADGTTASTLTAVVRDAHGNPVAGQTVELAATGAGNVLVQPPGLTDAAGTAAGTIASTVAETKTLAAIVNPAGTPVAIAEQPAVEFVADTGSISSTLSTATAAPASEVVADGVELSTITVTVRDANGNPVPGRTVQIAATGAGNAIGQPPGLTDAAGVALATLASTVAETKTVTVTVDPGAGAVVLADAPVVGFVADAATISATLSTAAASPALGLVADGIEESVVTVTVRDAHGNPVPGQAVVLAATGTANAVTQPPAPTDAGGVAAGTIATTKAELKVLTATVNPGPSAVVLVQTPVVEFLGDPDTISATLSLASANPATGVYANGADSSTITTLVRDANGNPVPGQIVFYAASGSENAIAQPPSATDGNGSAAGTIASTVAETKTVTITVNPGPDPVELAEHPTVEFVPDTTISAVLSTVTASPATDVTADGIETSTITVTVRDGLGNARSGIVVQLAATGANNTLTQPAGPTDASGIATGTIASITAETKAITAVADPGPDQVLLADAPTVGFVADAANVSDVLSTAVASPSTGLVADGVATATITVTVIDAHGNPVPGQTVGLASTGSENSIGQPPGTTDAAGAIAGSIASTVAETKAITATVNPGPSQVVLAAQPTVEFLPDAISPSLSTLTAVPAANVVADGVATSLLTATVRDVRGNPVSGQTVALSATGSDNVLTQPVAVTDVAGVATGTIASTRAETKTIGAVVNPGAAQVALDAAPTVGFIADAANIDDTLSTAVAAPFANVVADGIELSTITVTVRDAHGNPVSGQTVSLASSGTANILVQPGVTGAGGTAAGTIASTRAEMKTVTATVNPGPGQVVLIQQPTVEFVADAGNISASLSTVSASPTADVVADGAELSTITVTVRDANGNPLPGQTVAIAATGTSNTIAQPGSATDAAGQATATLASTKAEAKTITATANPGAGQVVLDQQPTVQFVADSGAINAALSTVAAAPDAGVVADGAETSTISVTVVDTYGNPISGRTVWLAATGTGNTLTQPAAVTDAAGQTAGSLAATVAETKTVSATVDPGPSQTALLATPTVTFIADPDQVSDVLTTVSAVPSTGVVADGVETSTITVTVRDVNGNPVPGRTVQLAGTGSGNTITQPAATTDAGGVTTGTIASTDADLKVVTATIDPGPSQVVAVQTPTIEFVGDAGDVSASLSLAFAIPATGIVADGLEIATIYVFVRDGNGNPVAGQTVALAATGAGNTIGQPAATTDSGGLTTGTLASTVAATKTITVTVNPGPQQVVLDAQPTASFVADAGNIGAGTSSVVADPDSGVVADGATVSTITVTVRDGNGNPLAGQTVAIAASGSGNTIGQPSAGTDASGVATGTLASTAAETKTISATVDPAGAAVVLDQQPAVEFVGDPSAISASLSAVEVDPAAGLAADGVETATITVTVRDGNGNAVPGRTVALAASGVGNVLTQPVAVTDAAGIATGTLAATAAETKTIGATVDPGAGETVLDDAPAIEFAASLASTYYVRQSGSDAAGCAGGTSPAMAWRTIGQAALCAGPGDTVYVGAGTYLEAITLTTSGAPGLPIRFIADSAGVYTGDAGEVVVDGGGANQAIHVDAADVEVAGFTVTGGAGVSAPAGGIRVSGDRVVVRGNTVYGNSRGIYVHDCDAAVIEENRASNNAGVSADGIVVDSCTGTVVRGNLAYNNGRDGIRVRSASTGIVLAQNTAYRNVEDGVHVTSSANTAAMSDCIVADNLDDGVDLDPGSSLTTAYDDVFGNADADFEGLAAGTGDLSADPAFVDPDGADDLLGGAEGTDDSFLLDPAAPSPAIDAGSAAAATLALADGTPFDQLTTRPDGGPDGVGADGATVNQGYHARPAAGALPPLEAGDVRLLFGTDGEPAPRFRTWDDSGASFSAAGRAIPAGATVRWIATAASPLATDEELVLVLSDDGAATELDLLRWTGAGWIADWTSTAIAATDAGRRGFALAYEAESGQALAVHSDGTATPVYRTYANGAWSAAASLPLNDGGGPDPDTNSGVATWIELAALPGSDEITLAFADANDDLVVLVWDGAQWLTAAASTLETGLALNAVTGEVENRAFDLAYEAASGDVLVAWGQEATNGFWSATRAAGTTAWSAPAQTGAPTAGKPTYVDLAREPGGGRIAGGFFDLGSGAERLGLATWDGGAWIDAVELDSQIRDSNDAEVGDLPGALGWVGTAGQAVCVYADDATGTLDWASWSLPTGWEARADLPIAGKGETESVALATSGSATLVLVFVSDDAGALWAAGHDGLGWTLLHAGAALETALSSAASAPFATVAKDE